MSENPFFYLGVNPTVDLIIINPLNQVLLIQRSHTSNACPSMYAIPGGFIDSNAKKNEYWRADRETSKEAALRELLEETNLKLVGDVALKFIGEYEGGGRDPRDNSQSWTKTFAYLYQIDQRTFDEQKDLIKGMDDAINAIWVDIDHAQTMQLAFDHNQILKNALTLLKKR